MIFLDQWLNGQAYSSSPLPQHSFLAQPQLFMRTYYAQALRIAGDWHSEREGDKYGIPSQSDSIQKFNQRATKIVICLKLLLFRVSLIDLCSFPKLPCAPMLPQFSFFVPALTYLSTIFFHNQHPHSKKIYRGLIVPTFPHVPCPLRCFPLFPCSSKTPGRPSLLPSPNFDASRFRILHSLFSYLKVGNFLQGETKIDRGERPVPQFVLTCCDQFTFFSDKFSQQ